MGFPRAQYLVETEWLAQHLNDPAVRVLEVMLYLHPAEVPGGYRVESGRATWAEGHIPGAGYIDLQEELSDRTSRLRFMMPPAQQFAEAMGRHGVGDGVRIVLYDRYVNMWAARVWWMLRAFGFDDAAVLNGGWKKWVGEGRPVATDSGAPAGAPLRRTPAPRSDRRQRAGAGGRRRSGGVPGERPQRRAVRRHRRRHLRPPGPHRGEHQRGRP